MHEWMIAGAASAASDRNADLLVFNPAILGRGARFVLKFRKPK